MERWGLWFREGLASLGMSGGSGDGDNASGHDTADGHASDAALPRASKIVYPLTVGAWEAVGEHLFEEQEYGVAVRYAHGADRDRWIDVYFYPAGMLSGPQFEEAARLEVDLIREAHDAAGHAAFDIGPLERLRPDAGDSEAVTDGVAVDLEYDVDGVVYSSAMVLLLHDLYFVKGRYSVERQMSTRRQTRDAVEAFIAQLRKQLTIASVGAGWGDGVAFAERRKPGSSLREIRLDYGDPPLGDATTGTVPAGRDVLAA